MAEDDNTASAGMLGDALTPAEQAYMDSGGQNTEALIAENAGTAAADASTPKADGADATTGKPSPDGAAKPDATKDAKPDAAKSADGKDAAKPEEAGDENIDEAGIVVDPTKPQKTVSFHKFERIRKKLEGEATAAKTKADENARALADLTEKFARGDERLKLLTEALTPAEKKAGEDDPEPDATKDIFAWIDWSKRQMTALRGEVTKAHEGVGRTQQTIEQRNAADGLKTSFQQDAVRFAQTTPDFIHAYNHMFTVRGQMLEDQGYAVEEVRKIIANEERQLVERAVTAKKSPAEMIYAMAQRFGYVKAAPAAGADEAAKAATAAAAAGKPASDAQPGNGAAAKPSVADEIARIKAGQEAAKTLSGTGGSANEISREALATMNDDEFETYYAQHKTKVDALMGRAN